MVELAGNMYGPACALPPAAPPVADAPPAPPVAFMPPAPPVAFTPPAPPVAFVPPAPPAALPPPPAPPAPVVPPVAAPPVPVPPPVPITPPEPVVPPVPVGEPPEQAAAVADRRNTRASRPSGACVAMEPSDPVPWGPVRQTIIRLRPANRFAEPRPNGRGPGASSGSDRTGGRGRARRRARRPRRYGLLKLPLIVSADIKPTVALKYEYETRPFESGMVEAGEYDASMMNWYALAAKALLPAAMAPTPAVPMSDIEFSAASLLGAPVSV